MYADVAQERLLPLGLYGCQPYSFCFTTRSAVHRLLRVSLPPTDVARRKIVAGDPSSKKQLSTKLSGHTLNPKQRTHRHKLDICCAMTLTCESEHRHKKSIQMNVPTSVRIQSTATPSLSAVSTLSRSYTRLVKPKREAL